MVYPKGIRLDVTARRGVGVGVGGLRGTGTFPVQSVRARFATLTWLGVVPLLITLEIERFNSLTKLAVHNLYKMVVIKI